MSSYITDAADCTVKQFMDCAFKERYKVLVLEGEPAMEDLRKAHELIHAQWVDLSGLFETREFELSAYIRSLEGRINTIEKFVELQKAFLAEFGLPFLPGLSIVKRYGHSFYWDKESPDEQAFLARMEKMITKEKRYEVELKAKQKELFDMQRKKAKGEYDPLQSRKDFVVMLNRLQQAKFVIDKNVTTIEELGLMVKDLRDQQQEEKAQRTFKKKW